jgi:hypothetical protein
MLHLDQKGQWTVLKVNYLQQLTMVKPKITNFYHFPVEHFAYLLIGKW